MFLICGEALYDFFLVEEGKGGRLNFDARPGGSPYNVAIGMTRLGASSALLTGMSNDMLGARLATILESEGVNGEYLVRTGRRTTLSLVGVDESGGPSYAFYGVDSADCSLTEAELPEVGPEIRGLHFGSYSIAVNPVADAFAALLARTPGLFVSFDPNVRPTIEPNMAVWRQRVDALRKQTTLLKVSDEDIAMLHPDADPVGIVKAWAKDGPALVVLTRGGDGVVGVRGEDVFHAKPPKTEVVDTVGAGDTFMATLLAEMSAQSDPAGYLATLPTSGIETLLNRAAAAAAITCSRRGADLPTATDLAKFLGEAG